MTFRMGGIRKVKPRHCFLCGNHTLVSPTVKSLCADCFNVFHCDTKAEYGILERRVLGGFCDICGRSNRSVLTKINTRMCTQCSDEIAEKDYRYQREEALRKKHLGIARVVA